MRPTRASPEHDLQRQVRDLLNLALPPDAWWTSIDHAGTSARHGAMLKARGVRRGIPDILILWREQTTVWLELKAPGRTASEDQLAFRVAAEMAGHLWFKAKTLAAVQQCLEASGIPLRARIAA